MVSKEDYSFVKPCFMKSTQSQIFHQIFVSIMKVHFSKKLVAIAETKTCKSMPDHKILRSGRNSLKC